MTSEQRGNRSPAGRRRPAGLTKHLDSAIRRRQGLLDDPLSDVCRVFHGAPDGIDGLVIEKLGPAMVVQLHCGRLSVDEKAIRELCIEAAGRLRVSAVYRKAYPKDRSTLAGELEQLHHDRMPWWGRPTEPEYAVHEAGVTYLVRPYDGYATGLYLDHRMGRERARALAAGRRLLNAFSYTCGFTVAAALGLAAETVSVDISRKSLEWGKRNLTANGIALDQHRFICSDVFDYYRRAARQGRRFDYIVLDPPTFSRTRRPTRVFSLEADLERLVAGAVELLDPEGIIQLSVNHRGTSWRRLETLIRDLADRQGRGCELLERPPLPADFRRDQNFAKSVVALVE